MPLCPETHVQFPKELATDYHTGEQYYVCSHCHTPLARGRREVSH